MHALDSYPLPWQYRGCTLRIVCLSKLTELHREKPSWAAFSVSCHMLDPNMTRSLTHLLSHRDSLDLQSSFTSNHESSGVDRLHVGGA